MNRAFKVVPANVALALAAVSFIVAPFAAVAADVPDALSVEWQGKKF
jgi:hypothetical protein